MAQQYMEVPDYFQEAISQDPDRFIKPLEGNSAIVDYFSFEKELILHYQRTGNHATRILMQDAESKKALFKSETIQNTIKNNIGDEGLEEANRKVGIISKEEFKAQADYLPIPSLNVIGYATKKGFNVKAYQKSAPKRFSEPEQRYLIRLKEQGLAPKTAMEEYRKVSSFPLRSDSSLKTKFYRLKK